MANLPAFPLPCGTQWANLPTRIRLVAFGPLPEDPENTYAIEMVDDGMGLSEHNPVMGGAPTVWVENWNGERFLARSAMDEPEPEDGFFAPGGDDEMYCDDDDERATSWTREVTREEFDRIVKAEQVRAKMMPPCVFTPEDEKAAAELMALMTD
jgi:hypothetical protein